MSHFKTIGHSNRPLAEFLDMLRDAGVNLLIDVRSFPKSRTNPDYNIDRLPAALELRQIGYLHMNALGGRRGKQPVDVNLNAFWRVQSFHNYADYAFNEEEFGTALSRISRLADDRCLALMCSEAVWWRCHRRIITDYLLMNGYEVDHLMAPGRSESARPTLGAVKSDDGKVTYPMIGAAAASEQSTTATL